MSDDILDALEASHAKLGEDLQILAGELRQWRSGALERRVDQISARAWERELLAAGATILRHKHRLDALVLATRLLGEELRRARAERLEDFECHLEGTDNDWLKEKLNLDRHQSVSLAFMRVAVEAGKQRARAILAEQRLLAEQTKGEDAHLQAEEVRLQLVRTVKDLRRRLGEEESTPGTVPLDGGE